MSPTRLAFPLLVCASVLAVSGAAVAEPAGDATAATTPSKAALGAMLKKCSEEADAKGLTVQMGKAAQRKAYRRSCMAKNGVMPKGKS